MPPQIEPCCKSCITPLNFATVNQFQALDPFDTLATFLVEHLHVALHEPEPGIACTTVQRLASVWPVLISCVICSHVRLQTALPHDHATFFTSHLPIPFVLELLVTITITLHILKVRRRQR